jgi:phosphoribosylaminoimidazole carboxylase PurE protein
VTVAGRSNALSGIVDAATQNPVVVCPPFSEQWAAYDIWSSLRMPSGVAPAVVLDPANAALFVAKILALVEPEMRDRIRQFQDRNAARLVEEDETIARGERRT